MFDFHMHCALSHDAEDSAKKMVAAAEERGLSEIAFTDHYDFKAAVGESYALFSFDEYRKMYDGLSSDKVKIRRGVEFGFYTWTEHELEKVENELKPDFIIGSLHAVGDFDPYHSEYWQIPGDPYERYLRCELDCLRVCKPRSFDVLGHLNYVCKSVHNTVKKPLLYEDYPELCDEILSELVKKDIGLEINTSGVDRIGHFLPDRDILSRFYELGGRIVTVGSDAHDVSRVGQYTSEAAALACEIFGYVCTFENRKPIFHKLTRA